MFLNYKMFFFIFLLLILINFFLRNVFSLDSIDIFNFFFKLESVKLSNTSGVYDDYASSFFGLPLPASETMNGLIDLYTEVCTLIICIFIVVSLILFDAVVRFRHIQYDVVSGIYFFWYPRQFTSEEEHFIDVLVIIIPTWIILHILAPSLGYIYNEEIKFYDVSISFDVNIIGCQWYWTYEYIIEVCTDNSFSDWNPFYLEEFENNHIIFSFDSIINMENPEKRLLSVYEPLVLPSHTNILLSFTSRDVIHSWALPQMGIKVDCIPGRITHIIFCSYSLGVFYGQCSELCGIFHGFMPICVEVIPFDYFFIWVLNTYFVSMYEQNNNISPIFTEKVFQLINKK